MGKRARGRHRTGRRQPEKRRPEASVPAPPLAAAADPRAEALAALGLSPEDPEAPAVLRAAAEGVLEEARATPLSKRRMELARAALALDEACVDAWLLLAEETAQSLEEALGLYQQAVEASARALGEEALQGGQLWATDAGQDYLRARQARAFCLWALGRQEEARAEAEEVLRLNPSDEQGMRGVLEEWRGG